MLGDDTGEGPARCLSTNKTENAVSVDARISVNPAGGHMRNTPRFHLETATTWGRAPAASAIGTAEDRQTRLDLTNSGRGWPALTELGTRTYGSDMPAALVPVLVVFVILAIDLWVYADAKQRADQGAPVVLRIGAVVVETPATWFVGCLLLWILFFPLYMVSRTG